MIVSRTFIICDRIRRDLCEVLCQTHHLQDAPRSRPDPDARADRAEFVRRLIDLEFDIGVFTELHGAYEAAYASAAGSNESIAVTTRRWCITDQMMTLNLGFGSMGLGRRRSKAKRDTNKAYIAFMYGT